MEKISGITIHNGLAIGRIFIHDSSNDVRKLTEVQEQIIVMANNLTPAETMRFGEQNVMALVVTEATSTSHTAILSRTMDWPALSAIVINPEWHGKIGVVDGDNNELIIDPNYEMLSFYIEKQQKNETKLKNLLLTYSNKIAKTKSGKRIKILANISTVEDIDKVLSYGAEGIGNFKTEFMYLKANDYPTEEELYETYKTIVTRMGDKKVIIRTFDIGTDKIADYFELDKEENPALGYRAIRIGLDRPEVFKTQLKAILRASAVGNVSIMYPMIVSVEEILAIKKLLKESMRELQQNNISFDKNIEQGIMIETPAAVIISNELAQEVDFFSIGTNDLIQYTLAADRQNPKVANVYNPYHSAIIRSIKYVVEEAHKADTWVEISGELGADLSMLNQFIELGVDAIAVSPILIPTIKKTIFELE